jgi:hypothetical protein
MATVATIVARQPQHYQNRYAIDPYYIDWINDLLEELSGKGFAMPSLDVESGFLVDNKVWIDKPTGMREIAKIWYPDDVEQRYTWEETNNRIKLTNVEVDENDSPDSITAFSNYATDTVDVNISDATEDEYKNHLLVITGGTYDGNTYVIASNTESAGGTTTLTFEHPLSTAFDGTKVTAGELHSPEYYVMVRYNSSYDAVSSESDEVPIDNKYERRITHDYLRFRAEQQILETSDSTKYWESQYNKTLKKILAERLVVTSGARARYMPGLDQYKNGAEYEAKQFETER